MFDFFVLLTGKNKGECGELDAGERLPSENVDEINELKAKNNSLVDENQQLLQEVYVWRKNAQQYKAKIEQLHNIILEQGHKEELPIDDQVVTMFSQLKQNIFRFIKRHCSNQEANRHLSPDVKDWWIMSIVCNVLWDEFFAPNVRWFGFGFDDDRSLSRLENNIIGQGKGK